MGEALPIPAFVGRDDVHEVLRRLAEDDGRERAKTRIRAGGGPIYSADPGHPGTIVEIDAHGERTTGRLRGRRFVADARKIVAHARRKSSAKRK